ncbi:MAG: hypothetical protein WKF88_10765 [Ferruginibacter sp.]
MRKLFLLSLCYFSAARSFAQPEVSGTVYDNSKKNYVEGVRVISTGGKLSFTDSMGRYSIAADKGDSLFFVYNNKPTQKFPVSAVQNTGQFDISLLVPVHSRYSILKEVIVYSKGFRRDSAENRETYANVFDYRKPRIETSISPGGGVGMDLNELINMFRFRRNKNLRAFQRRLETQEQEKYIDYRFNKTTVRRITQLKGPALDTFLVWYRPTYEFTGNSTEIAFNQYVLNALYQFRKIGVAGEAKKEE